jgi:hypothetical protein
MYVNSMLIKIFLYRIYGNTIIHDVHDLFEIQDKTLSILVIEIQKLNIKNSICNLHCVLSSILTMETMKHINYCPEYNYCH